MRALSFLLLSSSLLSSKDARTEAEEEEGGGGHEREAGGHNRQSAAQDGFLSFVCVCCCSCLVSVVPCVCESDAHPHHLLKHSQASSCFSPCASDPASTNKTVGRYALPIVRRASKRQAKGAEAPMKRLRSAGVAPTRAPRRQPMVGGETICVGGGCFRGLVVGW